MLHIRHTLHPRWPPPSFPRSPFPHDLIVRSATPPPPHHRLTTASPPPHRPTASMSETGLRNQPVRAPTAPRARFSTPRREKWRRLTPLERLMLDERHQSRQDIITICFTLSSVLTLQQLQTAILPKFLSHPRFCSVLSKRMGVYRFQRDESFIATSPQITAYHVIIEPLIPASLPEQQQLNAYNTRLNHIMSTGLDITRPLWKLYIFPNWSLTPDVRATSTTLVLRVHHSISDGIGLVKYFLSRVIDSNPSADTLLTRRAKRPARSKFRACVDTMGDLKKSVTVPFYTDAKTAFTQPKRNEFNHCAFLSPRRAIISDLKLASKLRNATLNDLLMASFAGAVRTYLLERGQDVDKLRNFHTAMPFNRHVFDHFQDEHVSNRLAMLPVRLPVHIEHPEQRLKACVDEMNRIKRSMQPQMALAAMKVLAILPLTVRRFAWRRLSKSASVLFSNVPGPISKVSVQGVQVQSVYVFPPIDSNTTVNIAMFSYDDGLFVAVSGDVNRLSDPHSMIEYFNDELESYLA